MSDVNVTVVGHAGTEPSLSTSPNGVEWTTFRLASTRRVRDPRTGEWADGETLWFTVKAFRDKARNLSLSVRKGDPVVVTGRFSTEEWDGERVHVLADGSTVAVTEKRYRHVIEAQHVGVDATRGMVRYARVNDRPEAGALAGGASDAAGGGALERGAPSGVADVDDPWDLGATGQPGQDAVGALVDDEALAELAEPVGA
jgi:single-strand DNA-binding protein